MKKSLVGLLVVCGCLLVPSAVSAATIDDGGREAENDAKISFNAHGEVLRITTLDDLNFGTGVDPTTTSAKLISDTHPQIGVQDTIQKGWLLQVKYSKKTVGLIKPALSSQLSYAPADPATGTAPSGNNTAPNFTIDESSTAFQTVMSATAGNGIGQTKYAFSPSTALSFGASSYGVNQSMTLSWNLASGPAQ